MIRHFAPLAVVITATAICSAQNFAPFSQSRYVSVSAWAQGFNPIPEDDVESSPRVDVQDSASASQFEAFDVSRSVDAPYSSHWGSGLIHASSAQSSTIDPTRISATGHARASSLDFQSFVGGGAGSAKSYFESSFLISSPTMVHFVADIASIDATDGQFFTWGTATLLLDGPSVHVDVIRNASTAPPDLMDYDLNTYQVDETLLFTPGTYTLRAAAMAAPPASFRQPLHEASYTVRLDVVPEPSAVLPLLFVLLATTPAGRTRRSAARL